MLNGFPCPNPTCTQVFPPDAVKGVAALTCPRCGTVYQFRSSGRLAAPRPAATPKASPLPQPGNPPKATPPASKSPPVSPCRPLKAPPPLPNNPPTAPVATAAVLPAPKAPMAPMAPLAPMAPMAPRAPAVSAPVSGFQFGSTPDLLVSPRRKKEEKGKRIGKALRRLLVPTIVLLVVAGAVVGGILAVRSRLFGDEDEEQKATFRSRGNFAFKTPPGWKADPDLRLDMHVNLALSRRKPRTHVGLYFRDYKTRSPGEGELVDMALRTLRGFFKQVQYEDPTQKDNKGRSGELGGEPALVLEFVGVDASEVPVRGQCFMLTRQGYGYWLFTWGPDDEKLVEEYRAQWDALRAKFVLLNEREGWKPQPRKTTEVRGAGVPYVINYAREVWEKQEKPKAEDERAELVLRGFEPVEDEETGKKQLYKHAGDAATVWVLVLPKAADLKAGVAAARAHLGKRLADASLKIEDVKDRKTDKPLVSPEVGALRGQIHKLRLEQNGEPERYGVLAVVHRPEGVLVVYGECKWDRQVYWDQEFKALLEMVRIKGKSPAAG